MGREEREGTASNRHYKDEAKGGEEIGKNKHKGRSFQSFRKDENCGK